MTNGRLNVAAVTLDPTGGGIAAVSRLVWRAAREGWGTDCRLITLIGDPRGPAGLKASTVARLRFGAALAAAQARGSTAVFYSHLSLGKVQNWLPLVFRQPYGIFLHGIEVWRPLDQAEQRVLKNAALLVANSSYTARRVREVHPWVGPIAECALALPELPPDTDIADRPPVVTIVARMSADERYKGHDQILEAWPEVQRRVPGARLVIVGDGDDAPRLRTKARELGLGETVVFKGFVSDQELTALYRQASVFAMPSREEGFGLVYLEAMAHGVACIGSIHDAASCVIGDGVTGFLVDQADVPALADRIVRLLSDHHLRREMGVAGRNKVRHEFSYPRFRDRLQSLLATALTTAGRVAITNRSAHLDAPPGA